MKTLVRFLMGWRLFLTACVVTAGLPFAPSNLTIANASTAFPYALIPKSDLKAFWGAKGDGIADDTVPVQNWLDAATNRGGYLFAPAGNYRVSQLVYGTKTPWENETNGTTIFGAGRWATRFIGISNNAIVLNVIGQRRLTLSDLAITTETGVTAQLALLVAREATSAQSMYNNISRVAIEGNFSKAAIAHLGAELCVYDSISIKNFYPAPCFYASDGNTLGLVNNFGTIANNVTTGNIIQNSSFWSFAQGGNCLTFVYDTAFSVKDCFFGTDLATNDCIRLVSQESGGANYWIGNLECDGITYEGTYARPYFIESANPAETTFVLNVRDHAGIMNVFGWATSGTNSIFSSSSPSKLYAANWNVDVGKNPYGSAESFGGIINSKIRLQMTNLFTVSLKPSTISVSDYVRNSALEADYITVGAGSANYALRTQGGYNQVDAGFRILDPKAVSQVQPALIINGDFQGVGAGHSIDFMDTVSLTNPYARIVGSADAASGNNLGDLSFWTGLNGTNLFERMRVTQNGNVGIGTNAPGATLHVVGTLRVDQLTNVIGTVTSGQVPININGVTYYIDFKSAP